MTMVPHPVPLGWSDEGRHAATYPGTVVYTAQLDREKLKCFYRCHYHCCNLDYLVSRAYLDVYTNGIGINLPIGCFCCCAWDDAKFIYYDNPDLFRSGLEITEGGCCKPFGHWCPHCCNCCGPTLVFKQGCCCPSGLLHWGAPGPCLTCPIDVLSGFKEGGEAQRTADRITAAREAFVRNGDVLPKPGQ